MEQEVKISKKKLEDMEEELSMLRNPQVTEEIKESLDAFRKGKSINTTNPSSFPCDT